MNRIHARKLYLADQFRMFDEADYDPSQTPVYEEIRQKKVPQQVIPEAEPEADAAASPLNTTVCKYKNVLKNGIVVGACESRYDHFVKLFTMFEQ